MRKNYLGSLFTGSNIYIKPCKYFVLRYNGKTGYFVSDIALVIVQENFLYLSHIAPVCLKFGQYSTDKYPASGTKGTVPGWGLTAVRSIIFLFI